MATGPTDAVFFQNDAERLHLLIDAVTDYAICMLDRSGFVTSWNVGATRLKGYAVEEIIGQNYATFFTPEERERDMPACILSKRPR